MTKDLIVVSSKCTGNYQLTKDMVDEVLQTKENKLLFIDRTLKAEMKKRYSELHCSVQDCFKFLFLTYGLETKEGPKMVVLELDEDMLKDEKYLFYVLAVMEYFREPTYYVVNKRMTKQDNCYMKFLLAKGLVPAREYVFDDVDYFNSRWERFYGETPDFHTETVLKRLAAIEPVGQISIAKFVVMMGEYCLNGTPTIEDINQFFRVKQKQSWSERLDALKGMEKQKEQLKQLIRLECFQQARKKECVLHERAYRAIRMAISGNPGVGKSTLLDILMQALEEEGVLKKGYTIVSARSLISDHVGGTEQRLLELVEKYDAIVIDEVSGFMVKDQFTVALIEQINYLLETRNDVHFFFIGYKDSIKEFFEKNSGLKSRIGTFVEFEDYTAKELTDIEIGMLEQEQYTFDENLVRESLKEFTEELVKQPDFGNARAMRKVKDYINQMKADEYADTKKLNLNLSVKDLEDAIVRYRNFNFEEKKKAVFGFQV